MVYYQTRILYEQDLFILYRLLTLKKRLTRNIILGSKKSKSDRNEEPISIDTNFSLFENEDLRYIDETDREFDDIDNVIEDQAQTIRLKEIYKQINEPQARRSLLIELTDPKERVTRPKNMFLTGKFGNILEYFWKSIMRIKATLDAQKSSNTFSRVSKIDIYARILYPLFFIIFNSIYWFYLIVLVKI